jgi:hypothetical protein
MNYKIIITAAALALIACGKNSGFVTTENSSGSSNNGSLSNPEDQSNATPAADPWQNIELNGYSNGSSSKGSLLIRVDKKSQSLVLILPVSISLLGLSSLEIAQFPGLKVGTATMPDGSKAFAITVPLRYLVKKGAFGKGDKLPNGDPLPFLPSGEGAGFSFDIAIGGEKNIFHLYLADNAVAVFIETPQADKYIIFDALFEINNKEKTRQIGAFGVIRAKFGYSSGAYLAAQIPDQTASIIANLIQW